MYALVVATHVCSSEDGNDDDINFLIDNFFWVNDDTKVECSLKSDNMFLLSTDFFEMGNDEEPAIKLRGGFKIHTLRTQVATSEPYLILVIIVVFWIHVCQTFSLHLATQSALHTKQLY